MGFFEPRLWTLGADHLYDRQAAVGQNATQQVVKDFGQIGVFVANAGTGDSQPLLDQSLDPCIATS
jgi:short-subunit dehydrogenase